MRSADIATMLRKNVAGLRALEDLEKRHPSLAGSVSDRRKLIEKQVRDFRLAERAEQRDIERHYESFFGVS